MKVGDHITDIDIGHCSVGCIVVQKQNNDADGCFQYSLHSWLAIDGTWMQLITIA